jgi:nitrile hydratase
MRPAGSDALNADALAALVTRDSMIGTGLALAPQHAG